MRKTSADGQHRTVSRRQALKGIGGALATCSFVGTAAADDGRVNIVDEGADPTGQKSINPILESIRCDDGTTIYFPDGTYLMDDMFRHTNFKRFELRGENATIVPASDYDGRWLFKLGTYTQPGEDLVVEGFTFDFTEDNTGLRVVQAQVKDDLLAQNLTVSGQHDSGKYGPFLFDITDSSGIGTIKNIHIPYGGEFSKNTPGDISVGPTGILVSPYHHGKLWVRNCEVGPWPDNGLYCSTDDGRVVVKGGSYKNSNIANIRLSGDYSSVHNATVIVNHQRDGDTNQRGIRLDGGKYNWVENTEVHLKKPNGRAISIQNGVEWARIQNSNITVEGDVPTRAIMVSSDVGKVDILNSEIEFNTPGQAIHIEGPSGADAPPVVVQETNVTGSGDGSHGRHAVRAERGNCTLDRLDIKQTGDDYRRGIKIIGDGCTVVWGDVTTSHTPIVNDADETEFRSITAKSLDGFEGMKILDGSENVKLVESEIYNGTTERGNVDVLYEDNLFRR